MYTQVWVLGAGVYLGVEPIKPLIEVYVDSTKKGSSFFKNYDSFFISLIYFVGYKNLSCNMSKTNYIAIIQQKINAMTVLNTNM